MEEITNSGNSERTHLIDSSGSPGFLYLKLLDRPVTAEVNLISCNFRSECSFPSGLRVVSLTRCEVNRRLVPRYFILSIFNVGFQGCQTMVKTSVFACASFVCSYHRHLLEIQKYGGFLVQRGPTSVGEKIKNTVFFGRHWKTRSAGISPAYLNTSHESRFKIDPLIPTRVKKKARKIGFRQRRH